MLAVVPIAIAANVFRVFVTGLLAHYVSVDTALGVFHTLGGWSIFLHRGGAATRSEPAAAGSRRGEMTARMLSSARCCCSRPGPCAPWVMAPRGAAATVYKFPDRLDTWQGESLRFSARIEGKLGVTDYVSRIYRARSNRLAHLYVGFYSSQRHGEMIAFAQELPSWKRLVHRQAEHGCRQRRAVPAIHGEQLHRRVGLGLGALTRSGLASVVALALVWYIVPLLVSHVPAPWNGWLASLMPGALAGEIAGTGNANSVFGAALSPIEALLVMALYALIPLVAGGFVVARTDA